MPAGIKIDYIEKNQTYLKIKNTGGQSYVTSNQNKSNDAELD